MGFATDGCRANLVHPSRTPSRCRAPCSLVTMKIACKIFEAACTLYPSYWLCRPGSRRASLLCAKNAMASETA
eukprot:3793745-Pyramimonas_sp.AAC.1